MIKPIAVVVIDTNALVRADPNAADGIHVKAGNCVAENSGNALHELRPVPALADESMKSAACRAYIDLIVLVDGEAASLAGNTDFNIIAVFAELVEHALGQNPRCTVKVNFNVNELGAELFIRKFLFAVKFKH